MRSPTVLKHNIIIRVIYLITLGPARFAGGGAAALIYMPLKKLHDQY